MKSTPRLSVGEGDPGKNELERDKGPFPEVYVIAEAGVNHNGDLKLASAMVEEAKKAGANAVKFQTFQSERLVTPQAGRAAYQKKKGAPDTGQLEMLRHLELSLDSHRILADQCHAIGIDFLSTPFHREALDFLLELGTRRIKIGSGDLTNLPFLAYTAGKGRPILLSTGMGSMEEVAQAVAAIQREQAPLIREGDVDLVLLHCTSCYPTPLDQVNLYAMEALRKRFGLPVGFSDHTVGLEASIGAVAMGACVIEKHFTLDRGLPGPDHAASVTPRELWRLVKAVRRMEACLGDGIKRSQPCEEDVRKVARKSLVAARVIREGERFTEENVAILRPGTGLPPSMLSHILGKKAPKGFQAGELICLQR